MDNKNNWLTDDKMVVKLIIFGIFLVFILYVHLQHLYDEKGLRTRMAITTGTLIHFSIGNKGIGSGNYQYRVHDTLHQDSQTLFKIDTKNGNRLENLDFPVIYDSLRPGVSRLLISPAEFKEYDLPFPDSLNWVKVYFGG